MTRAVFMGTPEIAVPAFEALCDVCDVLAVVCQPDRPSGRGLLAQAPALKRAALARGISVHQPLKVKDGSFAAWLAEQRVDLAVVMAYGRILPPAVLAAPRLGCVNLHASLLPAYRGAAPIQWAIVHGETETGVCTLQMEAGLDTGPVFAEHRLAIGPHETAGELAPRIAALAAIAARLDVPRIVAGELAPRAQDDARASYAPPITREHCHVDFGAPRRRVIDLVRGLAPRPGAFATLGDKTVKLGHLALAELPSGAPDPGRVRVYDGRPHVGTSDGAVEIISAQLEGRRAMSGRDLVNGRGLRDGDQLL